MQAASTAESKLKAYTSLLQSCLQQKLQALESMAVVTETEEQQVCIQAIGSPVQFLLSKIF